VRRNDLWFDHRAALPLAVLLCACTSYRTTTSRMETTAGADIGVPVAERFGLEPLEMRLHDSTFLELDVADTALGRRSAADIARLTLGIARLLQSGRREGQVVDSIRVTLVARDTTGSSIRTTTRSGTFGSGLLRQAADST
jgi:hypothetical protein